MQNILSTPKFQDAENELNIIVGECERVVVLTDDNLAKELVPNFLAGHEALKDMPIITVPVGEEAKDLTIVSGIWDSLLEMEFTRNDVLLCIGGGVISDLGGFVASCYKRGMRCVFIPTSLLSMVDAAVGGKTGINYSGMKNQIGTFYSPDLIWIDPNWLDSLPETELNCGWAEIAKYGLVHDERLWTAFVEADVSKAPEERVIRMSVDCKLEVVSHDPLETGRRKLLNFGHTTGHALESIEAVPHGLAVAWGLKVEILLSAFLGRIPNEDAMALVRILQGKYPQKYYPDVDELLSFMVHDKKNSGHGINFTLIRGVGDGVVNQEISADEFSDAYSSMRSVLCTAESVS